MTIESQHFNFEKNEKEAMGALGNKDADRVAKIVVTSPIKLIAALRFSLVRSIIIKSENLDWSGWSANEFTIKGR